MQLPGGFWEQGQEERKRNFGFKQLTGKIEMLISETALTPLSVPKKVTLILSAVLEYLGDLEVTAERIRQLAVGDRQFLMQRLALELGMDECWLTVTCKDCGARFDISYNLSQLPVKESGESFPEPRVTTSLGHCHLHVPTGHTQEIIAQCPDDRQALTTLLKHCVIKITSDQNASYASGNRFRIQDFTQEDLRCLEAALEEAAPEIATIIHGCCPDCETVNHIYVDPYSCMYTENDYLYQDVHYLASNYHWSQEEILSLSRMQRHRYINLIDSSRGMMQ